MNFSLHFIYLFSNLDFTHKSCDQFILHDLLLQIKLPEIYEVVKMSAASIKQHLSTAYILIHQ